MSIYYTLLGMQVLDLLDNAGSSKTALFGRSRSNQKLDDHLLSSRRIAERPDLQIYVIARFPYCR